MSSKNSGGRPMTYAELADEVNLLRAKCKVQDNEILSLREQLRAMAMKLWAGAGPNAN